MELTVCQYMLVRLIHTCMPLKTDRYENNYKQSPNQSCSNVSRNRRTKHLIDLSFYTINDCWYTCVQCFARPEPLIPIPVPLTGGIVSPTRAYTTLSHWDCYQEITAAHLCHFYGDS